MFLAIDGIDRVYQAAVARRKQLFPSIRNKFKGYLRMRQYEARHDVGNMAGFGGILFKEFHSGRRIIKQLPHDKRRPLLHSLLTAFADLAARAYDMDTHRLGF